jgi:hypothetical protein
LIWLIAFAVSVVIFPLRAAQRPLFESIMPVALAVATTGLALDLMRRTATSGWRNGLTVGLLWLAINVLIDLPLFTLGGPMLMPLSDYVMDIAVTYLIIPVITVGLGLAQR